MSTLTKLPLDVPSSLANALGGHHRTVDDTWHRVGYSRAVTTIQLCDVDATVAA
jgi:hypothetical protein